MDIKLLNTKAVAELTGLKRSTLIGLRRRGDGPNATQIGREYFYDQNEVEIWLKAKFEK